MAATISTHTAMAKLAAFARMRMPPDEERLLRFLFCDFEAACGVKSTLAGQIALLESGTKTDGGGPLVGEDMLYQPEQWADGSARRWGVTRNDVARRRVVLRELAERAKRHVVVLTRTYGPRNPSAPWLTFGAELAPLASLTPTAAELAARATSNLRAATAARHAEANRRRLAGAQEVRMAILERASKATGFQDEQAMRLAEVRLATLDDAPTTKPRVDHASVQPAHALDAALRAKRADRHELIDRVRDEAEALLVNATKAYLRVLG